MKPLHQARVLSGSLAALTLLMLSGCASTPKESAPMPSEEPVPMAEPAPAPAPEVELKPNYPEKYVVVKGDTLWDISTRFLKSPWQWPQLWHDNPQVKNPHLIYPGDVLSLYFVNGKPMMQVQRDGQTISTAPVEEPIPTEVRGRGYKTVKLTPRIREESLEQAIPTIPLDAIHQFLTRPRVVAAEELDNAPYVVELADQHLAAGGGYRVYTRGIKESDGIADYALVRAGDTYRDPDTGEILGYEAVYIGDARIQRYGDPATMQVTSANREILRGDRLLPVGGDVLQANYMPHPPENKVSGKIIAVLDGVAQIGQYQVVVLNLGRQEDVDPGQVLAVYQNGQEIKDTVEGGSVKLPDEHAGEVMVFRVFERVSYALVMRATRTIHTLDKVTNP